MRIKSLILTLLFSYLSIQPLCAVASELDIKIDEYKDGILHVGQKYGSNESENIKWLGTAFLIDDSCTFATAKHLFRQANKDKLVIRFRIPQDKSKIRTVPIRILYEDPSSDLAFLKIEKINDQPCKSGKLHSFEVPETIVQGAYVGEPEFIIGHPAIFPHKIMLIYQLFEKELFLRRKYLGKVAQ